MRYCRFFLAVFIELLLKFTDFVNSDFHGKNHIKIYQKTTSFKDLKLIKKIKIKILVKKIEIQVLDEIR